MREGPPRIAVAGIASEVASIARGLASLELGRLVVVGGSPGEGEAIAFETGRGAIPGMDLGALRGAGLVVLAGDWGGGPGVSEAASCVARYAPEAVVLLSSARSIPAAREFLRRSRLPPRRVLAVGGGSSQIARARALAAAAGVDASQVSLLVAGADAGDVMELRRYSVVAGIPAGMLEGAAAARGARSPSMPLRRFEDRTGADETARSARRRAAASSLLADAVLRDRRRILSCGVHAEATHGLPTIFATLPAVIGRHGCEEIFPASLTLEERSFVMRAAGAD